MGDRFKYDEWCPKEYLIPKITTLKEDWLRRVGLPQDFDCEARLDDLNREDFDVKTYGQAYDDVEKDVGRAMWWFSSDEADAKEKQQQLFRVLLHVVKAGKGHWSYYQGMHDIASVLILILGESGAYEVLRFIAAKNLDVWLTKDVQVVVDELIGYVYPLLSISDRELYDLFKRYDLSPVFSIGWVLTWFTHDVEDPQAAYKLINSLVMCPDGRALNKMVYMCGAIIRLVRDDVLNIEKKDRNSLHFFFTSAMRPIVDDPNDLPRTTDNRLRSILDRPDRRFIKVDELLREAERLEQKYSWDSVVRARGDIDEQQDRCESNGTIAKAYPRKPINNRVVIIVVLAVVCVVLCVSLYLWNRTSTPGPINNGDQQQKQQEPPTQ